MTPSSPSTSSSVVIKPPFPPIVDTLGLISKKSVDGRIPARAPNAFIIYRKVYVEAARQQGHYLPMTVVSSMASQSWEQEPEFVKSEYKRLAKDALTMRNEDPINANNENNLLHPQNPTNLNSTTPSTHTPPIESLLDMTLRDVIEIFKDEISPLSLYSSSTSPPPSSPTSYYYSSTPSSSTLSLSSTLCGEEDYQKEDFRKESFNLPPSVSANDISL
ncbi:19954_t:CDS:2 [Entrophospora sp. SA101]|nr:21372_t:CDS:2 [Entrophospora sp. SA101]CAJ0760160.1 19954_t:CDS:2 [Entrophospora sp. SA101]